MEAQQPSPVELPESEEREHLIKSLEERIEKHDESRRAVQDKLKGLQNKLAAQIDKLEEIITRVLEKNFTFENDRLQTALNELRENRTISALQKAKAELHVVQSYGIIESQEFSNDLTYTYKLKAEKRSVPEIGLVGFAIPREDSPTSVTSSTTGKGGSTCVPDKLAEEHERLVKLLEERLEKHDESRKATQDKLAEICEGLRAQTDELEERINRELKEKFASEDNRLQTALNELRENRTASALQKAKAELLVWQSYGLIKTRKPKFNLATSHELRTERHVVPELIEIRKPTNARVVGVDGGNVSVQFTCLSPGDERIITEHNFLRLVKCKVSLFKKGDEQESKEFVPNKKRGDSFTFTPDALEAGTTYGIRVKMMVGSRESEWSDDVAEFAPELKECCIWKKCPGYVDDWAKYSVDEKNSRVATKVDSDYYCTIIGNIHIPLNKVTRWSIKILKSRNNDGSNIYIGVAPNDINQNDVDNWNKCGWYLNCYFSTLHSGPPHNYSYPVRVYGPRKGYGQYVHIGDSVGVVMDTTKGDLSFVLNGVNHGVAHERIPLDKPLAPCVILRYQGDSVELII